MRTIVLNLSAEAASLPDLDAAFSAKVSDFLGGIEPIQVTATDNSAVRVVDREEGPTFQSDREYRIAVAD